jgi:hypothetical protein
MGKLSAFGEVGSEEAHLTARCASSHAGASKGRRLPAAAK